jgi:hypothetical protein
MGADVILLRERRERPRSSTAAEQRYERAPLHVIMGTSSPMRYQRGGPVHVLGFPAPQPATEKPASPWGRPELF